MPGGFCIRSRQRRVIVDSLLILFQRDLGRLRDEIYAFPNDDSLWKVKDGITNTAGHLVLHLVGNLRHFIGHVIGESGYERDRAHEFGTTFMQREDLLDRIDACEREVVAALSEFNEDLLNTNYPIEVFGEPMTYAFFLQHLNGHFNYHLGQINYYRRLGKK